MRKAHNSAALLLAQQQQQQHGGGGGGGAGGSSESYSSNSSYSDGTYSDSSDLANWEEYVAANGTLFYAEYVSQCVKKTPATAAAAAAMDGKQRVDFARNSSLRLGKKAAATPSNRRQQQQQQGKHNKQQQQQQQKSQQKHTQQTPATNTEPTYKFSHIKAHDGSASNSKQLELVITAADRFRFGRRSTAVESILGFRVAPFADKPECLMLLDFVHDMPAMQQQQLGNTAATPIQRGDWFYRLDDIDIRACNVEQLLLQFVEPTKVCLKFQGPSSAVAAGDALVGEAEATAGASGGVQRVENFAKFAQMYEQLLLPPIITTTAASSEQSTKAEQPTAKAMPTATATAQAQAGKDAAVAPTQAAAMPFVLLILPPECYQQDEHKDSLYYYPGDAASNFLYKTRGSFLTLNAVLTEELKTQPLTSRLLVEKEPYFVNYRSLNSFLVLFGYAAHYQSSAECGLRSDELIGDMRFAFPTLTLENFANGNQTATELRSFLQHFCDVQRVRILLAQRRVGMLFEELLRESRLLALPKEAQLRIFDALSEMEAMDYRNWNDEPLNTHREFFIYGSVLYYDHYLLAAQMPVEVRASVEGFLRCRGVFDFIATQAVKALHVWEEIALPNATGRYFLTVCSRSHLLLAVILKIFDAPDLPVDAVIAPSLFYIEEIQETLDHLIQCGIESLAMFWSVSNKRPEVWDKFDALAEAAPPIEKDSSRLETFIKQTLSVSSSSAASALGVTGAGYDEEAQLCSSLGGSSIHSLTPSEEDGAQRKRHSAIGGGADDSDSGSDWEHFGEQHLLQHGHDAATQSYMTESLYKEINNVLPVNISPGWKNSLYYYIYVDYSNGTIFCPLKANAETFPWLREMRSACHAIREVLQRSRLARQRSTLQDNNSNVGSGSLGGELTTVKEYATTIQVRDEAQGPSAPIKARFTVVGRLFHAPTREVYICHHPDVPQNMIELAFRLSFFSAG